MKIILTLIVALIFLVLPIGFGLHYAYNTVETMTCTVDSKERITDRDSSRYMIFCDEEVLANTDALFHGKFNSADYYRDINEGEVYTFEVNGWRVPFLSWNRNILSFE